ncbi:MAG: hypothetical protein HOP33_12035 [Verrucomicrobia bacterium]|nr:hypothetical protein [Verrucomicrobiota bacterium]
MKTKSPLIISLLLFSLLVTACVAPAAVITWTNTSGGLWSVATNWSPNTLPTAADDVVLTAVGDYTVTLDVHPTVASLTLGGSSGTQTLTNAGYNLTFNGASVIATNGVLGFGNGTLAGPGLLTVRGRCLWGAGNWLGAVLVAPGGALDLVGNMDRMLTGVVTNQGTITWSGANHLSMNNCSIHNLPGGVFEIQNNQWFSSYYGVPTVNNSGTIRKSAGGGDTIIGVRLINSGTLDAQSGRIAYVDGSQFNSDSAFTGTGTNYLYNGTVTLNGPLTSQNLEIATGVTVTGTHTLSGAIQWTGGTISGAMTIATNGTLNIMGTADHMLSGTLNNQGLMLWSGVHAFLMNNGHINNLTGGLFEIQNNQTLSFYYGAPNVNNSGIIRKSAGGGDTVFGVPLINTGTLDVLSGRVAYVDGSQFNSGTVFTGTGTNFLYNGTVTLNGSLTSQNLEIATGVTVAGTHTLSGTVRWTGGIISGAMTIATNGTLNITGTADHMLSGTLNNQGLMVWAGTNTLLMNNGHINNLAGGVFEIQNNQVLAFYFGAPNVNNSGTIRKSTGGGDSTIGVPLINSGTLDVLSGRVGYVGGSQFNSGSVFTGTGTNVVYTGTVTFNGSLTSQNLEIASDGTLTLAGNHTLGGTIRWVGGTISGAMTVATNGTLNITGTADRALSGSLNNQGLTIWSGANMILMANGHLTNLATGLFEIQNNQVLAFYSGVPNVSNSGTIRKSAGGGDTFFGVPLINSGTLDVQSGRLAYAGGSQFNSGTAFTGTGTNLVYTGTVTFNGAIPSENLEIAGATFNGNSLFSGLVNWTSGALADDSALTVATNGMLNLSGSASKSVIGSLTNAGLVTWSGPHDVAMHLSARIVNQPGALLDIQNNQSFYVYNGVPRVLNSGTIRKSTGGGNSIISVPLINSGVLDVTSGLVGYGAGSQFNSGTTFTGAGTNLVYTGTATFTGNILSENLVIGGATVLGDSIFVGTVNWTSGEIGEPALVTIATNGTLNITGTLDHSIRDVLNNAGHIVWSGANVIYFVHTGTISNLAGGTFEMQNDGVLAHYSGVSTFRNAGLLRKSAGAGNTTINLFTFHNTGTVDVQTGTVVFGNYTQAGGKLSFGLNSLTNFGRLAFANNIAFTGTLGVDVLGGFRPQAGDAFALITYPSRTGLFTNFDLSPVAAWQTNSSIYGANAITLTVLNARPTLDPISDRTGDEETAITFTATATDPDLAQTRIFNLLSAPSGATINTNTGAFSWTPTEAQGPSTNNFAVQVSDNGIPMLAHTQSVTVVVNEVNRAPVATAITLAPVNELVPFVLATNLATDPDLPANTLSYSLINPPQGAVIDQVTGVISWTPTEAQGPSTNACSVRIADNGSPTLAVTNTFTLIVSEVNATPVLASLDDCTHVPGAICWITNSASDSDLPTNQLSFSLVNAPPGMSIGPTSGVMIWGPPLNCAPLTNIITVRVTDNGSPALTNEQTFIATLISPPRLKITRAGPNLVVLSWHAAATDAGFALQSTTNLLMPAGWQYVAGTPIVIAGENFLTNNATTSFQAYRLASALTPLPTLQIATANSNVVIVSWPATATALGFILQVAPTAQPPSAWNDATSSIGTNGSFNFITDPQASGQRYYRLRLPAPP